MGTGMENYIPEFREREWEWKIAFPTFGNGNGNEKIIPKLWEREWEAGIPGNGREREFPLTPVVHYTLFASSRNSTLYTIYCEHPAVNITIVHYLHPAALFALFASALP